MGCGGRRLHHSHPQPCTEVLTPARSPAFDGDALGTEWPNRTDHGSPCTLSALAERRG
jgi:hypothetical protein